MEDTPYFKYQGAGNDFILIDNREGFFDPKNEEEINALCNRYFGIGGDGLILIQEHESLDFEMVYFNSDGKQSTMCGNGGRCAVSFAYHLGIIEKNTSFQAIDGPHDAEVENNGLVVNLKMVDVREIQDHTMHYFLDTGSPHHIEFKNDIESIDVAKLGHSIRYGKPYNEEGSNVNFVELINPSQIALRTYERGVEGETLACGTGATAAALASYFSKRTKETCIEVEVLGGKLEVSFEDHGVEGFKNIWLKGPAKPVFKATLL